MEKPNCLKCKYYYVTWEKGTPHGCKIYGIKSQNHPTQIVAAAGQGECQGYTPKAQKSEANRDQGYGN